MKKLFLCVTLLSLFSCEKLKELTINQQKETPTVTARLVTDASGINDFSFNASAWQGIMNFYGDSWQSQLSRDKLYDVVNCNTQVQYIPVLSQAAAKNIDLIIATGFSFDMAIQNVALENPNKKFLIVDVDWVGAPNVMQAVFAEHEGSYLVGVAAALKAVGDGYSGNPTFGFIGGIPGSTITKFEVGYIQGILSIIPNAVFVDFYTGDWGRPDLAKDQAKKWYDSGVFAIFSAAGNSGRGTIAQAKEYRASGKNVWAIGVDSDQYEEGKYNNRESAVLTSMVKRVDNSVLYALKAVQNNSFIGEVVVFDLQSQGVDFSTSNMELTIDIRAQLEYIRSRIIEKKIIVYETYEECKTNITNFPKNLMASDSQ